MNNAVYFGYGFSNTAVLQDSVCLFQATKLSKKKDNQDATREGPDLTLDESGLNVLQDEDSNDMPETMAMAETTKTRRGVDVEEDMEEEELTVAPPLMGIDDAILYSIDKCGMLYHVSLHCLLAVHYWLALHYLLTLQYLSQYCLLVLHYFLTILFF